MAQSGLTRIDGLFGGEPTAQPVGPGDPDRESVGAIQDLLRGHGQTTMPNPTAADYGLFGQRTAAAVSAFRRDQSLDIAGVVDAATLSALVRTPAATPVASRPYVTMGLDFEWSGMTKIVLLTSILEGEGGFGALNRNTDKAGLSYGLLQWAQKPGRLHGLLQAFCQTDGAAFVTIFGGGDATVTTGLLNHTALPLGGVNAAGETTDASFDLTDDTWSARFQAATLSPQFQTAQVTQALAAFQNSARILNSYAPEFTTERAIAFMLDVANQFGDGGAKSLYQATAQAGQAVADRLSAIANESVNRMAAPLQQGTSNRRTLFLHTPMLADTNV
jgi:hypothetical protein